MLQLSKRFIYAPQSIIQYPQPTQPIFQPQQINTIQNPSQPVIQPQQNPPPLPPGHEYHLDEFHTNNFLDELARQAGYEIRYSTSLSKLPPGSKKIRPKSEKAKALQEMIEYAKFGINIENNRPDNPMEIDLAIINLAKKLGGGSVPVNATRTVRKKKPVVKKRVIKKVVKPKRKRVNLVTYEEPTEENPNNEDKEIIEEIICKKIIQDELKNILSKFKALLPLSSSNILEVKKSNAPTDNELISNDDIVLDKPMDINLVCHPANDITTAECRINNIIIDKAVLDGVLKSTMMSRKLARRIRLKIDTSNQIFLEGVSTDSKSYGMCYNIPITFTNKSLPRNTDFTLECNIIVTDYNKYALIIGTDWLDLASSSIIY
ncbi:3419_t:CDS:2 [Gigaspora margarita]|uniref:3419_t:CDS:1 n=1 Tax=Gigaspora margarita TaxID=4874 RepID=A0ABM8W463_GIGMA|nr:3419_t:CDS:2 [Gigaspora margarita]